MSFMTECCPKCGRLIPASAPRGLCPGCLVASVLEGVEDDGTTARWMPAPAGPQERVGNYELLEALGRGGMGAVFRARDFRLNRIVALKLLLTGKLASDSELKRFRTEAEAAAQLEHPNIVPIYEVGDGDGRHFLAMKFIEGGTLAERIAGGQVRKWESGKPAGDAILAHLPTFPPAHFPGDKSAGLHRGFYDTHEAAVLLAKVARAVHYAHQHGILHRDLKPANVLLDEHGEPFVSDFGLARRVETESHLTSSRDVLGTPAYLAPEVVAGGSREATTASDVYSLGAILYELLAGRPPFEAESVPALLWQIAEEEPVAPSRLRARLNRHNGLDLQPERGVHAASPHDGVGAANPERTGKSAPGRCPSSRPLSSLHGLLVDAG